MNNNELYDLDNKIYNTFNRAYKEFNKLYNTIKNHIDNNELYLLGENEKGLLNYLYDFKDSIATILSKKDINRPDSFRTRIYNEYGKDVLKEILRKISYLVTVINQL